MKAALYCRLSEEDRNKPAGTCDSGSIQNQKTMLLQYAMEQGWDVFDIYSDDDYAGADRRRPQFNRLLRDAQQHKFDIVLCKTQSRFTRELELVEKYIHGLFPAWGIRFVSIVDNADTASKGNKKSRQINGLVNEWYLEDMSDNIRSVLDSRRENGFHIGAFALYGYQKDPKQKGRLVIDEEAAAVVREVFTLFSQGYGKTAIARLLNDRGIPNPTEYKRQGVACGIGSPRKKTAHFGNILPLPICWKMKYISAIWYGKIRQRFLQDKAKQAASQGTVVPGGGNARTDHRKSVMGKSTGAAGTACQAICRRDGRPVFPKGPLHVLRLCDALI